MKGLEMKKILGLAALVCALVLSRAPVSGNDFDWMPKGGCELLQIFAANCENCDDILEALTEKKSQDEWAAYFKGKTPGEKRLSESELNTISSYLAYNFPLESGKFTQNVENFDCESLPPDGSRLMLEKCSFCHPVAPVMTLDRDVEGWRSAYYFPPMPESKLSNKEIETLIRYLAYNTPVPVEDIPAELLMEFPGY
jgi:hypothetical protein